MLYGAQATSILEAIYTFPNDWLIQISREFPQKALK